MSGQKPIKYRNELNQLFDNSLPVAELGVAQGLFSRDMLKWKIPKLYLVDVWSTLQVPGDGSSEQSWHDKNFENVLKIDDPRVEILRGVSWDMASRVPDESCGLVYIDACHSEDCVRKDLESWFSKVVKGGVIALHDFANPDYGVGTAARRFAMEIGVDVHIIPENHWADASGYFIKSF